MILKIYAHGHEWKILLRNRAQRGHYEVFLGKNVLHVMRWKARGCAKHIFVHLLNKMISNTYNNVKQIYIKCFTKYNGNDRILIGKEGEDMAQSMINFRMDAELKRNMEEICRELGLSMTTAFTIFARKMTREKRIPFEVSVDPFYSESNISYLKTIVDEIESGEAVLVEHELIEE